MLKERFPIMEVKTIRKLINDGMQGLYMPVKNYRTDVIVCDFHHAKDRICAILNKNSFNQMQPHYKALIRFLGKYTDKYYYAVFTDEEQALIEANQKEISGLCIYTM